MRLIGPLVWEAQEQGMSISSALVRNPWLCHVVDGITTTEQRQEWDITWWDRKPESGGSHGTRTAPVPSKDGAPKTTSLLTRLLLLKVPPPPSDAPSHWAPSAWTLWEHSQPYPSHGILAKWLFHHGTVPFISKQMLKYFVISIVTPVLLGLPCAQDVFIHPFSFNWCVSLIPKWVYCKQYIIVLCFSILSDNL
jgi:hypothetical protein